MIVDTIPDIMSQRLNRRQTGTLTSIFEKPVRRDIRWADIETLIRALEGKVEERAGSRVVLKLNGVRAVFHRPHPRPETDRNTIRDIRDFLEKAGVTPAENKGA